MLPNIPFSLPSIGKEEEEAVLRVLRSGWLTTGKETLSFENEFAQLVNAKNALAVNSATSGLMLSYDACGVDADSCILTTPYTFVSTATAARHLGAHVIYADIEKDSYNIDCAQIEAKLKADTAKKIKVVVPVHIAGHVCNMEQINTIAQKFGIPVIEDAAHAFPSKTKAGYAGTLGNIGVYSFYATKTITTAEGGMICTNNDEYAKRMSLMRMHGIDRTVWDRYTSNKASWEYDVLEAGFKCNLPDILSAIGREQLKKAQKLKEERKKIAHVYNQAFESYDFLQLPPDSKDDSHSHHLYLLRIVPKKLSITRNEFAALLQKSGIGVSVHFIPHFNMTYWKKLYNLSAADFPNAQNQFERTISLPLWAGLNQTDVERVIKTVIQIGSSHYE